MENEKRVILHGKNINFNLEKWNYEKASIRECPILVNRGGFLGFLGFKKSIGTDYITVIPSILGYEEEWMAGRYAWIPQQTVKYNFPSEKDAINFIQAIKIYVDSQYKEVKNDM